ncbi:MAG: anti-sigma factor antagonist [Anaerolineae bacterium]|nr:anti-sigma factor antagonist [Anaerolineae bacterium]
MGEEHRIVIPGVLARIPDVCDFVVAAARRAGFNERAVYHCQMAVDEACTNIIEHGFGGNAEEGQIEIVFVDDTDAGTVRLTDDSPSFNPLKHSDPDPTLPLAERTPGGWGIYFIKKMMDETSYTFVEGYNRLTMVKRKTPQNMAVPQGGAGVQDAAVRVLVDDIWEVAPTGRLESNSAPELQTLLDTQLEAGRQRLVVNMATVHYISSSGLKVLVNAWRRARDMHGDVVLVGMKPQIREIFEMVGFDQVFDIYDSVEAALENLHSRAA